MKNWPDSIYSDGTLGFVSNMTPTLGDKVFVSVRMYKDSPVTHAFVRKVTNGAEQYIEMEKGEICNDLVYYKAEIEINEPTVKYIFVLATKDTIYYYNREGYKTYIPDYRHDFVILADHHRPDWVNGAVFYQIFPERFWNGDKENDVRTGEYEYNGKKSIRMDNWNEVPLSPDKGRAVDFYGGDLRGIKEKIPYLKELGVTAIYLNPIFTAYSTHKYDCIDYFHVDPHFGGDEALAELSEALHENDMKLVLDISINHTGIMHPWTKEKENLYFKNPDGSLKGWAGFSSLPVLDYRNEELRKIIYKDEDSVLRKWLKPPYNIDGWRFDVADVLARNDDVQLADEVWKEVCSAIRQEKEDAIIIGEHWADCNEYLQGDLWNTPMNYYGYGRIIRQFAGLPELFISRCEPLAAVDYQMTAKDVVNRTNDHYNTLPQVIADCQMNLYDSHDVPRVHNYECISFEKWKLVATSQLLFTGIPCIYYGDELGIDGYVEHDAGFRYPMCWDRDDDVSRKHFKVYKTITGLRREKKAFAEGGRKVLFADGRILVVARFFKDEMYLGILSMEDKSRTIRIPVWEIGAAQPASDKDKFGDSIKWSVDDGDLIVEVPAYASYIFEVK
ncbi:alpha-amylase family glycosyl hydrolase [Butyrivibrio sp. JL13D10]|uniref:alpha-amylase family glycosyl hydrolase n=1 Tax=Butyrivibrio sp. JL13D10 TaxID=3236815 RepID=UPI0038B4CF69